MLYIPARFFHTYIISFLCKLLDKIKHKYYYIIMKVSSVEGFQEHCPIVDTFGDEEPDPIISMALEDQQAGSIDGLELLKQERRLTKNSPVHDDESRRAAMKTISRAWQPIEKGARAELAKTVLGCGHCALAATCQVVDVLNKKIQTAEDAADVIKQQQTEREGAEKILPYALSFQYWSRNQLALDGSAPHRAKNTDPLELIRQNVEIKTGFLKLLEATPVDDRDQIIDDIFHTLSPKLQKDFVERGFINGIIAELYVYEQLKELEATNKGLSVELSSTQEDIHEGYDIKIELASGKTFLFDVKSYIPNMRIDHIGSHYVEETDQITSTGEPVYIVSMNPNQKYDTSYMPYRSLGTGTILSFAPKAEQPKRSFQHEFVSAMKNIMNKRPK